MVQRGRLGDEAFAGSAASGQPRRSVGAGARLVEEFLVELGSCGRQLLGGGRVLVRREPGGDGVGNHRRFRIMGRQFRHDSLLRE